MLWTHTWYDSWGLPQTDYVLHERGVTEQKEGVNHVARYLGYVLY